MWKCPECEHTIEYLQYHVNTTSSEYGTADLSDTNQEREDRITEFNSDDYGDNNWDGSPEYRCPECDSDVSLNELIWINEDDDEEEDKPEPEPEPEETLHNIILPENNIIRTDIPKQADESIICKNKKCKHIFVIEKATRYGYGLRDDEETFECPKCATSNTLAEYKELLLKGYF
jgi:hypothetical protein